MDLKTLLIREPRRVEIGLNIGLIAHDRKKMKWLTL